MNLQLADAQARRQERGAALLHARVEDLLDEIGLSEERCVELSNADHVGPAARKKLSGLMRYYAKKPHPFTSCVEDNTKRFGVARAKKVCAVLKDLIEGTTKWRHGGGRTAGAKLADDITICSMIDDDVALLLEHVDHHRLRLLLEDNNGDR
jgi:hypothetical protein